MNIAGFSLNAGKYSQEWATWFLTVSPGNTQESEIM